MNNLPQTYESVVQQRDELAVENARYKFEVSRCHQTIDEMFKNRDKWIDKEWLAGIWSTSKRLMNETPATDEFTRELMAKGVDALAVKYRNMIETMHPDTIAYGALKQEFESVIKEANKFAGQLRKGINDAQ